MKELRNKFDLIKKSIELDKINLRILELNDIIGDSALWNDHKRATLIMKEKQGLDNFIKKVNSLEDQLLFFESLSAVDLEIVKDDISNLELEINDFEISNLLNEPNDNCPAILTISAGSGGLESANWVSMLLRMYLRYANIKKFNTEILDLKESEEHSSICIDSVSIRISGTNVYGFLKGEDGVHRLIRNSPFSSSDARHTSFAAVSVLPDIEDYIDIKILDKDLDITAIRAGGPGGQHSNKVSSAIRLKHIPTGINIVVRTERDQHANRRTAMKMLKAKLYEIENSKKLKEKDKYFDSMDTNGFGSQIRTTTLMPFTLVKDHRSGIEVFDANSVLDGNLSDVIFSVLRAKKI